MLKVGSDQLKVLLFPEEHASLHAVPENAEHFTIVLTVTAAGEFSILL